MIIDYIGLTLPHFRILFYTTQSADLNINTCFVNMLK